jgi:5-dehydro-2-deoxygluconokinase
MTDSTGNAPARTNGTAAASKPATAGSGAGEEQLLLILAADHRDSLERELYGLTAPPTPVQAARISADKLLIYQALLDVRLPTGVQPGILIDEQYGASIAELAGRAGTVSLSMPVEQSGQDWFQFAYGDDWQRHAGFFASDHVKVLVRDNPGLPAAQRQEQARRLAAVSAWAAAAGRPLILELLVPATDSDKALVHGDTGRYDDEVRPALTVQVMRYLQDQGVEPALWKVEGLDRHDDAVAVAAMARRGGRPARCIVLGRHAPREKLDHWLEVAAPIPGFAGFAIGRSIWWDALHAHLHHRCTAAEARNRISENYYEYARYYLSALEGELASPPDPEFW